MWEGLSLHPGPAGSRRAAQAGIKAGFCSPWLHPVCRGPGYQTRSGRALYHGAWFQKWSDSEGRVWRREIPLRPSACYLGLQMSPALLMIPARKEEPFLECLLPPSPPLPPPPPYSLPFPGSRERGVGSMRACACVCASVCARAHTGTCLFPRASPLVRV